MDSMTAMKWLRFEGGCKPPASTASFLGFDALTVRVPVHRRALGQDLRQWPIKQ
jgi:hypothetical protein